MARINLLPWREKIRKQRKQEFLVVLGIVFALTGALLFGVHLYQDDRVAYQQLRIDRVKNEIRLLNSEISEIGTIEATRRNLKARIDKVIALERNRAEIVHLFSEISKHIPKGVFLTGLTQAGNKITIRGMAQDNNDISRYILNLEKSAWLDNLGLEIITHKGSKGDGIAVSSEFSLTAEQTGPDVKKSTSTSADTLEVTAR